jgi:hypothetical protein
VVVCASLVVGDEFVPVSVFTDAFAALQSSHAVDYHQVTGGETSAVEAAASRIAEFLGDPSGLVSRMDDVEVPVVHCAPVTREVLAASASLRLVGCDPGGPVNLVGFGHVGRSIADRALALGWRSWCSTRSSRSVRTTRRRRSTVSMTLWRSLTSCLHTRVVAGCPVPVVMAGGKKVPEREALGVGVPCDSGGRRRCRHGT